MDVGDFLQKLGLQQHETAFRRGFSAHGRARGKAHQTANLASTAPPIEDVALIAELHSLPSADLAPPLDLTPQRKKDKTFEALLRQVEGLSRQRPVLMIFDDLHWIDPSSRELLDRTIERVTGFDFLTPGEQHE
jgi:hypothetical protein